MAHLVDLTVALGSYDHTLDLTKGDVSIAGTRPDFVSPASDLGALQRWHVSEVPLIAYAMLRAAGDDSMVAIPVFTSRTFPHRAIYVRADRVRAPRDLRGARVGIASWGDTTGVWARGMLADMYGVMPGEIEWWQGSVDGSNPAEALEPASLPDGVALVSAEGQSLEEMLWNRDLDALIAPGVSERLRHSTLDAGVGCLFEGPATPEREYHRATGCLPPHRTIAIRREVLEERPWIASNLYRAFEVAKRRYFVRLTEISASRTAIPWTSAYMAKTRQLFGEDPWPYGVEPNRASLEVFLRYAVEQGLLARRLAVEDLFTPVEPFVDGLV